MPPHPLAGGGLVPARSLFLPPVRGRCFRHRFLVGGLSPPSVTGSPPCAGGEGVNAEIFSDAYGKMLVKGGKFQGEKAKTHSEKMKLWSEMGKK